MSDNRCKCDGLNLTVCDVHNAYNDPAHSMYEAMRDASAREINELKARAEQAERQLQGYVDALCGEMADMCHCRLDAGHTGAHLGYWGGAIVQWSDGQPVDGWRKTMQQLESLVEDNPYPVLLQACFYCGNDQFNPDGSPRHHSQDCVWQAFQTRKAL